MTPIDNNDSIKFVVRMIDDCTSDFKRRTSFARHADIAEALQFSSDIIHHFQNEQEANRLFLLEIMNEETQEVFFSWRNYP